MCFRVEGPEEQIQTDTRAALIRLHVLLRCPVQLIGPGGLFGASSNMGMRVDTAVSSTPCAKCAWASAALESEAAIEIEESLTTALTHTNAHTPAGESA